MKVYIAGPIQNNPDYMSKFYLTERLLWALGYDTFNPARLSVQREHAHILCSNPVKIAEYFLSIELPELEKCDSILMMHNWGTSYGARREYKEACRLGKAVMFEGCLYD